MGGEHGERKAGSRVSGRRDLGDRQKEKEQCKGTARTSTVGKKDGKKVFPRRHVMSRRSLRRSQVGEERGRKKREVGVVRERGGGYWRIHSPLPPHYLASHNSARQ